MGRAMRGGARHERKQGREHQEPCHQLSDDLIGLNPHLFNVPTQPRRDLVAALRERKAKFRHHSRTVRNRRALPMTDTELSAIARAATIGLSSSPNAG